MQLSKTLMNGLTDFYIGNIGEKILNGVTYCMVFKDNKDMNDKCKGIRDEANKLGYDNNMLFRIYETSNGYVYDMDLSMAKHLAAKMVKTIYPDISNCDEILRIAEEKRKASMDRFAKLCLSKYEKGEDTFEVALYNRNSVPRIVITGRDSDDKGKKKNVIVNYNAFTLRHWDISDINDELLYDKNLRVSKLKCGEILPTRTGVRFEITLDRA